MGDFPDPRESGEPETPRPLVLQASRGPSWVTSSARQWTFPARRRAKRIISAPTVSLVSLSIKMMATSRRFFRIHEHYPAPGLLVYRRATPGRQG